MNNLAYLALGTNMGNRYKNLVDAICYLKEEKEIHLVKSSSIYDTVPVGYTEQDDFLNMVILIRTALTPYELLEVCLRIEKDLGRKREFKWGPRIIDLDILLYNQENIEAENLIVPHPRMQERAFVLAPLLEIDSSIKIPDQDKSIEDFFKMNAEKEGVRIWKQKNGEDVFALFEN
ncbi:2-amino-4-hydroxy-6-hydroxymethyldihydropteridinepyrophosphokinase [Mycobacteroides abscessus subsp. abscessus]|nr:2-amino-4-hydroxy-6-hydroxymethyldihydropteridinepyrophosphokinase [Mycobacteroides abscessus subsp. abscessus]